MDIRLITKHEMTQVNKLILDVFMKYEAPDYGEQGVLTFRNAALENDDYMSSLMIYGAYIDNELAGVIATRNEGKHIALFFVKEKYHKHGIGRALFHQVKKEDMTVNSSPYAKKVYEHLGFIATDAEQAELGMRYIPMKYSGKKLSEMSLDELWHLFPIRLDKPNSMWCRYYSDMEEQLTNILAEYKPKLYHIGSTAIHGIWAKPIVDVLAEFDSSGQMNSAANLLADNGFVIMSREENRISLNLGYTNKGFSEKVYHIHLRLSGDINEVYFRDYLNDHYEIAKEYEALKLGLWKKFEFNRDAYTEAKTEFVKKYTDEAKLHYNVSKKSEENKNPECIFCDKNKIVTDIIYEDETVIPSKRVDNF